MHRSTRAAVFVLVWLLIALITAIVLYLLYADGERTSVALLAGCVFVAFVFAVLAIRVAMTYRRSRRLESDHGVPPNPVLRSLALSQWLILLLGIAFIAVATGAGTALQVVGEDRSTGRPTPSALPATTEPTTPVTTEPTTPPPTIPPTEDSTPTGTPDPAESSPEPESTESLEELSATTYLDSEEPLAGDFADEAVNFSAKRYPRGIQFWCSSVTSSRLQWNVAGYRNFTAVAGIDDRTKNSFGAVVEFIFYDQDGRQLVPKPVEVSVGRAQPVSIDLSGVVSLRMTCASRDTKTGDQRSTRSALGDPILTQ